jgi:pentatricopeptide repeat protein
MTVLKFTIPLRTHHLKLNERLFTHKVNVQVFRWVQKQRWYVADNGCCYSKLISVMGKKGQTRMAMWLFSEMRDSGCRPGTPVYNALITAQLHSKDKTKTLTKGWMHPNN